MIRDHRGGRGSRLHRGDDGIIYAYAQWPDRATFEADTELPAGAAPLLEVMSEATLERPPTIYLTTNAGLLLTEFRRPGIMGSAQAVLSAVMISIRCPFGSWK
jgi:hypothetical protein